MRLAKIHVAVGDRVRLDWFGQVGDTGIVLRLWPKKAGVRHPGGVKAIVEVKWDSNGYVGRIEDRKLKKVKGESKT